MIKYQTLPGRTSVKQINLETASQITDQVTTWKKDLGEQIEMLKSDIKSKVPPEDISGRRIYIDALIGSIEDLNRECLREKTRYHNLLKYGPI